MHIINIKSPFMQIVSFSLPLGFQHKMIKSLLLFLSGLDIQVCHEMAFSYGGISIDNSRRFTFVLFDTW